MKFPAVASGVLSILLMLTACSSRQDKAPYESRVAVPGTRPEQQNDQVSDSVKLRHKQQQQAETDNKQAEQIKQSVMAKMEKSSNSHTFPPDAELRWKWPVTGTVVQSYRPSDPARRGILISGEEGEGVSATESGEVVYSADGLTGYGQLLIIKHNKNYLSVYAHNRERLVTEGEWVARGAQIATMGRSSGKAVLHFEIRHNGDPENPLKYLGHGY